MCHDYKTDSALWSFQPMTTSCTQLLESIQQDALEATEGVPPAAFELSKSLCLD